MTERIRVHVYVDGAIKAAVWADQPRGDIANAFPGAGPNHGWTAVIPSSPSGSHQVCAWAINILGGSSNTKLPCRTVTVP